MDSGNSLPPSSSLMPLPSSSLPSSSLTNPQLKIVKFLRHLLPILSSSFVAPPKTKKVISKVISNLDFYLPFRQHAPSLMNARREIYANVDRLASDNGVGFFNILAFRGVFFGSPFATSDHYRWFDSLTDWEHFRDTEKGEENKHNGEEYYVKKNCYGQSQNLRKLSLLPEYWNQRLLWNNTFNKSTKPTVTNVYRWLTSRDTNPETNATFTVFRNIGSLTALLICGDLVEAGILPMPSIGEWADSVAKMGKGSKWGMEMCGFIGKDSSREEFCDAFASLDQALQKELSEDEMAAMGYNIIMLEHALCKINRISTSLKKEVLYSEIFM